MCISNSTGRGQSIILLAIIHLPPNMIMGVSDAPSPVCDIERVRLVAEIAKEYENRPRPCHLERRVILSVVKDLLFGNSPRKADSSLCSLELPPHSYSPAITGQRAVS